MSKHRALSRGDVLPASFLAAQQEVSSTGTYNFAVEQATVDPVTSVRVVGGTGDAQVGIPIMGRWRYNTATVTAAHPGGAAGVYDVYVTGSDNSFSDSPLPDTDSTNYAFGLVIRVAGSPPATALYRKVATVNWNGSAILGITQTVQGVSGTGDVPRLLTPQVMPAAPAPGDPDELDVVFPNIPNPSQGANKAAPVVNRVRYRANAPMPTKWEVVGGPPLMASIPSDISPVPYDAENGVSVMNCSAGYPGIYFVEALIEVRSITGGNVNPQVLLFSNGGTSGFTPVTITPTPRLFALSMRTTDGNVSMNVNSEGPNQVAVTRGAWMRVTPIALGPTT